MKLEIDERDIEIAALNAQLIAANDFIEQILGELATAKDDVADLLQRCAGYKVRAEYKP